MQSGKTNDFRGMERLIERQMLLSRVRESGSRENDTHVAPDRFRFITISRELGALGNYVASELAQRLGWQVFDKEIVNCVAENSRVHQELVRELDEKTQSLIHDSVDRLLRMAAGVSFGHEEYHLALLRTLATLAARGRAIIVGRGGTYALQGEAGLHVRITGSLDRRVERISKRNGISPDDARRLVLHVDAERRSFIQRHFKANLEDLRFYDLVFNTDRIAAEQVADSILSAMGAPAAVASDRDQVQLPSSVPNPKPLAPDTPTQALGRGKAVLLEGQHNRTTVV